MAVVSEESLIQIVVQYPEPVVQVVQQQELEEVFGRSAAVVVQ